MRIPTFWARASRDGFEAPGWSFSSIAEAKHVAEERLTMLIDVLVGGKPPAQGRYLYGDRPVREPVIETVGAAEHPEALITRNAYGALCLNTEDVAFVDVDGGDLDRIRRAATRQSSWSLRVYATRAGFRVVATHARLSPIGTDAEALFDALGADPLYRTLCKTQQSFRARLTPKPWRIGQRRLPVTFPWRDAGVERTAADWVRDYDRARADWAVCTLVEELGPPASDPTIARVLALHDRWTLADGKQLA
jgi:hypothetical protein